jgi:hypothetical protein
LEHTPEGWVGFLMHRGNVKQMQDGALGNCSRAGQKANNAPGKKIWDGEAEKLRFWVVCSVHVYKRELQTGL